MEHPGHGTKYKTIGAQMSGVNQLKRLLLICEELDGLSIDGLFM